jgi:hypothetical protein
MGVTARVATGVQALWVVIAEHGRTIRAIIPREALESCWDVGPEQDDLLRTYAAHKDHIETEVRNRARTAHGDLFLVKDLSPVSSPRRRTSATHGPRATA